MLMTSHISNTLFRRCHPRSRRFCSCSVWGRSTTACSSSWTRLPSTCSASVVSGRTLSKQVKKMALAIFFDLVLALDCHADQTGCWRFFHKLSIKLTLKLFWADTEALRWKHAVSKWGRGLIAVGCSLNHTAWALACVAGSSWKPATPCLTTCWKSLKRRLVISCLKSGYTILCAVKSGSRRSMLAYWCNRNLSFFPLLRALHHLGNSQPQVCARAGVQARFRQGEFSC